MRVLEPGLTTGTARAAETGCLLSIDGYRAPVHARRPRVAVALGDDANLPGDTHRARGVTAQTGGKDDGIRVVERVVPTEQGVLAIEVGPAGTDGQPCARSHE